jgi:hypothetical protein
MSGEVHGVVEEPIGVLYVLTDRQEVEPLKSRALARIEKKIFEHGSLFVSFRINLS